LKTLAQYVQDAEDELGRQVTSTDGARNLVEGYVNKAIQLFISRHPFTWALVAENEASSNVAIVAGDYLKSFPANTLDVRTIMMVTGSTDGYAMVEKTPEWLNRHYGDVAQSTRSRPLYWATVSITQFMFAPKSDSSYTLRLRRTQMPTALSGATVSILPNQYDQTVVEGAVSMGFRRLRMFAEADQRWKHFVGLLELAISEDKDMPGLQQAGEPWSGPGATEGQAPLGNYWAMPEVMEAP